MNGKKQRVKLAALKKRPIRQSSGSPEELKALASSWLARPVHEIVVTPSMVVADGHRRLEGLELLGVAEAEVFVLDAELGEHELLEVGLVTAIHRAGLEGWEKYQAVKVLTSTKSFKEIAEMLRLTPAAVTHLMSVDKCIHAVQEALKAKELTISDCYAISKLPPDDQPALMALKKGGASGKDLEHAGRKKRAAVKQGARSSRIKVPLTTGATVTVAGAEMSLDEAIEALSDAVKLAKAALSKGLHAKTAQSVWKDLAAAG